MNASSYGDIWDTWDYKIEERNGFMKTKGYSVFLWCVVKVESSMKQPAVSISWILDAGILGSSIIHVHDFLADIPACHPWHRPHQISALACLTVRQTHQVSQSDVSIFQFFCFNRIPRIANTLFVCLSGSILSRALFKFHKAIEIISGHPPVISFSKCLNLLAGKV